MKTLYIEPGSPREKGYVESFNGKLRDELLDMEIFETLKEAQGLVERWRREYNHRRSHSTLTYRSAARWPDYLDLRSSVLSLGVDFSWSRL